MKPCVSVLLLLLGIALGCNQQKETPRSTAPPKPSATAPAESFETIESPSMQYLPREDDVEGWRLQDDPLVVPAAKLAERLDRDSAHFLLYEVTDLTVGEYRRIGGSGFCSVEIFRFPDFVKAFGAYSARRAAVVNYLDIGNESYIGPHSIHAWCGPFYVRLIGGGAPDVINSMKILAAAVAESMPKAPRKPAVFDFLPEKFRVVNSESFVAEPGFGQPFLANSFIARFDVEGELIEGLILPAPNKQVAVTVLDEYRKAFGTSGRLLDPIMNLGEDNFTAEDRHMGRAVAFRLDRFVIAFRGYRDKQKLVDLAIQTDQRIRATIRRELQSADDSETATTPRKFPLPTQ